MNTAMNPSPLAIFSTLDERRRDLGLSCASVAKRAGLGLSTVQRILSGEECDPGFGSVSKIAQVLGVSITLQPEDLNTVRRRQAERKATELVAMVQGTSALEAQAMDDPALASLKEKAVRDLLKGSSRKLWAE